MNPIKLQLTRMPVPQKAQFAQQIVTKMTSNPRFPDPTPALSGIQSTAGTLSSLYNTAQQARLAAKAATAAQNESSAELDTLLSQLAAYVFNVVGDDETAVNSAGMQVRNPRTPSQPLVAPSINDAIVGETSGSVKLGWGRLRGAKSYVIEHTADATGAGGWTNGTDITKASGIVTNLTPGTKYLFRVAGVNAKGKGSWSQSVCELATL
jgi:hypothetical protein